MNRKVKFLVPILIVIFTCVFAFCLFEQENMQYVAYSLFINEVNNGNIVTADITSEKVVYTQKNDSNIYYTDNPEYDSFKEYLLLNDVKIENSLSTDDLTYALDFSFYTFFIGIIIFGAYKLYSFTSKDFKIIHHTNVKFKDVAGLDDLKKEMLKIVDVLKNPKSYVEKGIRPTKGIILEGPPGNGKTLFAKALVNETNVNFIATKGADFQSALMSVGPRKIKSLFKKARKNKPWIIFIDEFDGIGEKRNYAGSGIDKENNRMIIAMLNEMDGFSNEDGVLVIAATNSYLSLDQALIRPGRFDRKYRIDNPNPEVIEKLIDMYTKNKKLDSKIKRKELAKCFEKLSSSAIETVLNEAAVQANIEDREEITMQDIIVAGKVTNTINIKLV